MKRKVLKTIAIVLVLTFCTVSAAGATDCSTKASAYLDRYWANIYAEGDGDISIWFEVEATGKMDEIGALSIRLQQQASGSSTWKTIKTYSYKDYSNMLANNDDFYGSNVDYSGIDRYSYRAYVTIWAGKNGTGDSREVLTETVVAQ